MAEGALAFMLSDAERAAVKRRLKGEFGVVLSPNIGARRLATLTAIALARPTPVQLSECVAMMRAFAGLGVLGAPAATREAPPFEPLKLSDAMERALARCREYREIGSGSDGGERR